MESLLSDEIKQQVEAIFAGLEHAVQIILFTAKENCATCDVTRQLLIEVVALSEKLELVEYDIDEQPELAHQMKISRVPGMVIAGKENSAMLIDYGIRLLGVPSGHEFTSLINDLVMVANRNSGLSSATLTFLSGLTQPVLLQVLVTPDCQYCPQAVVLAHQMALQSPLVEAEMIEVMEFPDLANLFNVSGVPHTSINSGAGTVIGAVPEDYLVAEIARAIKSLPEAKN